MWWTARSPVRQARAEVAELARPPWRMATTWSTSSTGVDDSLGDADGPAPGRRGTGHGDVAAEAHEGAGADPLRDAGGGAVGGQGLGRRTEVESHTAWDTNGAITRIELHVLVAGHRTERPRRRRRAGQHLVEIGVVAQRGDRVPDRGVDGATRAIGRVEGDRERLEEQIAHGDGAPGGRVECLQL